MGGHRPQARDGADRAESRDRRWQGRGKRAEDEREPTDVELAPVVRHLKALQRIQKEDILKAGGAYVNDGYLVADELGRPSHPETLSGWFENAVDACGGVRRITLHGCRHTCATSMLKAGVPIHVVSMFLGHSSVQITLDTYAHVLPGQGEQAVTALVAEYS